MESLVQELSSKADELASQTPEQMIELCQDLLNTIYHRSPEWSHIENWKQKYAEVNELKKKADNAGDTDESAHLDYFYSELRFVLADGVCQALETYIEALEHQSNAKKDTPQLLESVRTLELVKANEKYKIYGPGGLSIPGHTFEVWTRADVKENEEKHVDKEHGKVSVVLGAGNQPFLSLMDLIHSVIAKRMPVLLKHHPIRPFLLHPFSILLEPLLRRGYCRQVLDEGVPQTINILSLPSVGHVQITGSLATDIAVRKTLTKTRPNLSKEEIDAMVTSELGAVTPAIIVPVVYSDVELGNMAIHIATSKKKDGGCNCLNANAVIMSEDWPQKEEFEKRLMEELRRQPTDPAYYPGARDRIQSLRAHYEEKLGKDSVKIVEGSTHNGFDSTNKNDNVTVVKCGVYGQENYDNTALTTEAFGPLLALVELPGGAKSKENFVSTEVAPFLNDKTNIFGTLSCVLFGNSEFCNDKKILEEAIASLKYGTVAVNTLPFIGYGAMTKGAVWGAHPTDKGRQSGFGFLGNAFNLPNVDKSVVYAVSLEARPALDSAQKPPSILFDALHVTLHAPSKLVGAIQLSKLCTARLLGSMLSYLLPRATMQKFMMQFGNTAHTAE